MQSKPKARGVIGVAILKSGEVVELKKGSFDASQSEAIATALIVLASKVRNAVRSAAEAGG